jgi:hypothetical protein
VVSKLELYGGTMQKDCGCELQTWINFIVERAGKLSFLKKPVEEAELVTLFLKGLHPVFNQLQVYFAIPGSLPKTFEGAVAITRKFASNPTVAADLAKLRSNGMSQTMFSLTTAQGGVSAPSQKSKQLCKLFASSGTCSYGARCKFVHTSTPAAAQQRVSSTSSGGMRQKCNFCSRHGHTEDVCNTKQRLLEQLRQQHHQTAALSAVSSPDLQPADEAKQQSTTSETSNREDPFYHFVFTVTTPLCSTKLSKWVLDSGATCCATFTETDCVDIRDCNVNVTAAGITFQVHRIGTAVIDTLDEHNQIVRLHMHNTLISERFPYKLLALQLFTTKGCQVTMGGESMRIVHPKRSTVLVGSKDAKTKLFFLQESTDAPSSSHTLLMRSYGGRKSDSDQLWQLHLRHGHRNFADLCRQYNVPAPKQIPACTSCIMAKSHVQPHLKWIRACFPCCRRFPL